MKVNTDVDIDVFDRSILLDKLRHIGARINREDGYVKHNTGVYFQKIPYDPVTGMATFDHKEANDLGYMKIDFLNNSVYKGVRNEEHLKKLIAEKPQWDLLEHADIVANLVHIHDYADLVKRLKPTTLPQLAMILALIRPGKKHLQKKTWAEIEKDIWIKPTDGSYFFKKSHSFAFALSIIVQLNLMVEQALKNG
ncbi:hypothetical protein KAR91_18510 [Candidatus Pacearchaeota archaeon]|nr:hypothetical protein [Candidatus Pacearchaeota archaeon]